MDKHIWTNTQVDEHKYVGERAQISTQLSYKVFYFHKWTTTHMKKLKDIRMHKRWTNIQEDKHKHRWRNTQIVEHTDGQ